MKWHSLTSQQEQKSNAVVLIVVGLFMLLKGPMLLAVWAVPGAEEAPSFDSAGRTLMIAGGVMIIAGAAIAWRAWVRPK